MRNPKRRDLILLLTLAGVLGTAVVLADDFHGYRDPEFFTRLPGFLLKTVNSYQEKEFDAYEFIVKTHPMEKQRVEGRLRKWNYALDQASGEKPSPVQIMRNYQNAATRMGGSVVHEDNYRCTLRMARNGGELWVEVAPSNTGNAYHLTIVERQTMTQDVVASAAALQAGLAENGHVAAPGIFFDFNKSALKPESEPALQEMARFLQANPALKVWVVGHTDAVGTVEANLALSNARAAAVVQALTTRLGVAANRLGAFGAGPYAPVATNATEEGRSKNRRVELVAQP